MKKILAIIMVIFFSPPGSHAQLIVNGDFQINSGNNATGTSCPTFTNGSVLNWIRTHGEPGFVSGTNNIRITSGTDWTMPFHEGWGQGIAAAYHFVPLKRYYISLGLRNYAGSLARLHLVECATVPTPTAGELSDGSGSNPCLQPESAPFVTAIMEVLPSLYVFGTIHRLNEPYANEITVCFTPGTPGECVMLTSMQIGGGISSSDVTHIYISRACEESGDLTIATNNVSTGFITPDPDYNTFFSGYYSIFSGSSFGGTAPVMVDPSGNTTFEAKSQVVLSDDFNAIVNANGFFLAEINPYSCDYFPEGIPLPGCASGSGKGSEPANFATMNLVQLFPNPTQNSITVAYPCISTGQLVIGVKDVSGRVRYSENVSCNEGVNVQHVIDMSTFSPGVYFVDLTLNDQHVVKKVVKI